MFVNQLLRKWLLRLMLCAFTSISVAGTAFVCAWLQYRTFENYRWEQLETKKTLISFGDSIRVSQNETGKLPDLALLRVGNGWPSDGWYRPIRYEVAGDQFTLFSFGADDQPGGRGLDADLFFGGEDESNQLPTLWQFAAVLETEGIFAACLLAALLTFPACLISTIGWPSTRSALIRVVITHCITALLAIWFAVVIAVLHLPSGH